MTLYNKLVKHNLLKLLNEFEVEQASVTEITSENFDDVFDKWREIVPSGFATQAYVQAFFHDLANKGCVEKDRLVLTTHDTEITTDCKLHQNFWLKYKRPVDLSPITSQKDRLVDLWSRRTDGEFFTPSFYATLGHDYLKRFLGDNLYSYSWWDMCCGTGNLTKDCPEEMFSNLYMSTLNEEDVNILNHTKFKRANVFCQDFLNTDDEYDFLQTSKNWVFILNPPYSASPTVRDEHKKGVSDTKIGLRMKNDSMNKAASNLTTQFLWKILQLSKQYNINITVGMFTQISFAMNPSYSHFYNEWKKCFGFVNGFCFHCSEFEGTTGEWPVVFSVWSTQTDAQSVVVDIFENQKKVGVKEFSTPNNPLSKWIVRPKNIIESVPFTSAITVATPDKTINLTKLPQNALGFAVFAANDVMHSKQAYLLSAPYANGSGWGVTQENMEQSLVALGLRAIIKGTWLNDRDQFSVPDDNDLYKQFKNDMIVWLLFSNFNHTSSVSVVYDNKFVDIQNHFYWKDGIIADWLINNNIGIEAQQVVNHCNNLYNMLQPYKNNADSKYQLSRADAGWYQWRKALCGQNAPNQIIADMYSEYKKIHKTLTQALMPMVYELHVLPKEEYFSKMKNSKQNRLHTIRN